MDTPELQTVKKFVRIGPFSKWIHLPEFPTGIKALWDFYRDESAMEGLAKRVDLLCVEPILGHDSLDEYKPLFEFLCRSGIQRRPLSRISHAEWKMWVSRLLGRNVWIFEAKCEGGSLFDAVGQVLVKRELFKQDYPDSNIVGSGVICERSDELIEHACSKFGVKIFKI
jgi:hypothetical protein